MRSQLRPDRFSYQPLTRYLTRLQYSSRSTSTTSRPFPVTDTTCFDKDRPTPSIFPHQHFLTKLPAFTNWFTSPSTLNTDYLLSSGDDPLLPVEITTQASTTNVSPTNTDRSSPTTSSSFTQSELPFSVLLAYLTTPEPEQSRLPNIYLAQTPPPKFLEKDLPAPFDELGYSIRSTRSSSSSGSKRNINNNNSVGNNENINNNKDKLIDIYATALWLGLPHTSRTPLHRDPNSNIFIQLAGHKAIRCFPPAFGEKLFGKKTRHRIRGAEMMVGEEKERIDKLVWDEDGILESEGGYEAIVGRGDGVYIKEGWWHAVRGVIVDETGDGNGGGGGGGDGRQGDGGGVSSTKGIVASVNWWFR